VSVRDSFETIRGLIRYVAGEGGHNNYRAAADALNFLEGELARRGRPLDSVRQALTFAQNTARHEEDATTLELIDEAELEVSDVEAHVSRLERQVDDLRQAYELKIDDLRRETLRTSQLQKELDGERKAVAELWARYDEARAALGSSAPTTGEDTHGS
jgi:chromosome segregation ATPase